MKQLDRRLKKLEASNPSLSELPIMFITFVGGDGDEELGMASVPGSDFPYIHRNESESEDAFRCRVYAMKAINKPSEEMSDAELEYAMAAGREAIAKELAETGAISDESLKKAAGQTRWKR